LGPPKESRVSDFRIPRLGTLFTSKNMIFNESILQGKLEMENKMQGEASDSP